MSVAERTPAEEAPNRAQLAEMDAWDQSIRAHRRDREDAARARGEYVPDPVTHLDGLTIAMRLGQRQIHDVAVVPVRASVYRLDGPALSELESVEAALGVTYAVAAHHGHLWVRALEPLRF